MTQRQFDKNTGLYYFGSRHYDTGTGTWMSQDKYRGNIQDPRSLHRYQYNYNSPVNYYDSYGYSIIGDIWSGIKNLFGGNTGTITSSPTTSYSNLMTKIPTVSDVVYGDLMTKISDFGMCRDVGYVGFEPVKEVVGEGIVKDPLEIIADQLKVDINVIRAIVQVESNGSGFYNDNTPIVRFEGQWFKRFLEENGSNINELQKIRSYDDLLYTYTEGKSDRFRNKHGREYYEKAYNLNPTEAMLSSSFGAFQIMGFHYSTTGFDNVQSFVDAHYSYEGQGAIFINYISSREDILKTIKDKDFTSFARLYNGSAYKDNNYDVKMRDAYNQLISQ